MPKPRYVTARCRCYNWRLIQWRSLKSFLKLIKLNFSKLERFIKFLTTKKTNRKELSSTLINSIFVWINCRQFRKSFDEHEKVFVAGFYGWFDACCCWNEFSKAEIKYLRIYLVELLSIGTYHNTKCLPYSSYKK